MHKSILTIDIRYEHDVVLARQRARQIAGLVGFDLQDQTRISTSTSELARNVFQYVGSGRVEFGIDDGATGWLLSITVSDKGGGVFALRPDAHRVHVIIRDVPSGAIGSVFIPVAGLR